MKRVNVGWIIHDLMQLRIPRYFEVDKRAFLDSMTGRSKRCDFIITNSECTKRDVIEFLDYPEERICVIYPGVDHSYHAPDSKTSQPQRLRPYIYYLGSLALNKNVDGMLRIYARCVNEHGLDIDLILSGKDFFGEKFWHRITQDLNIVERVHFTGWVSDDERESLLSHALMLWQFSWYEGFGLPVLEAASRGIPVLYSNRGALPEILQNPEQEIDPANEEEAAARAADAITSQDTLERWRVRGLKRSSEFSWKRSSENLLNWLESRC